MKHIRKFKIFENNIELIIILNEILLELEDNGLATFARFNSSGSIKLDISLKRTSTSKFSDCFTFQSIEDNLLQIELFLNQNGFYFSNGFICIGSQALPKGYLNIENKNNSNLSDCFSIELDKRIKSNYQFDKDLNKDLEIREIILEFSPK